MEVVLRPLRPEEWAAFRDRSLTRYADDLAALPGFDRTAAAERSEADHRRLLDRGLDSPGQHVFVIEGPGGEPLGTVWFAEQEEHGRPYAYLYDIEVAADHRGGGVGRAAMVALEAEARRRGLAWIDLNVFGTNAVARHLYDAVGYQETFVRMRRLLG